MGEGEGEDRAKKAAENAIKSPLMTLSMKGAKGILLNVTTGPEISLGEMADAAQIIEETADQDAQVIWGHVIDESLGEKVHITLIATFPDEATRNKLGAAVKNPVPQKNAQTGPLQPQEQPLQPQQPQYPRTGRTIYDIFNEKRQIANQGLQEANLTTPNNEGAFPGHQKKFYDQPAIFRKGTKS